MTKKSALGTIKVGMTDKSRVLITIVSDDGTETAIAISYPHFQNLTEKVKAQLAERRRRFVAGESDAL